MEHNNQKMPPRQSARSVRSQDFGHAGGVVNLYKNLGETPREWLERLRARNAHYAHEVLSYAGRLDPMAEGVLLCLVGSANHRREAYLDLGKEYMLDVLFGFSTDTYDILGRVIETGRRERHRAQGYPKRCLTSFAAAYARNIRRTRVKRSRASHCLSGRAAGHALARSCCPAARSTSTTSICLICTRCREPALLSYIETSVDKVNGDFRQEEVMRLWKRNLQSNGSASFPAQRLASSAPRGTYARSIAHKLGTQLGVPALALHILRTKVGEFTIEKSSLK